MIFLDIQMAHMNGLKTAEQIRRMDSEVAIIFLTTLNRYGLEGYKYQAMNAISSTFFMSKASGNFLSVSYCRKLFDNGYWFQIVFGLFCSHIYDYLFYAGGADYCLSDLRSFHSFELRLYLFGKEIPSAIGWL